MFLLYSDSAFPDYYLSPFANISKSDRIINSSNNYMVFIIHVLVKKMKEMKKIL